MAYRAKHYETLKEQVNSLQIRQGEIKLVLMPYLDLLKMPWQ